MQIGQILVEQRWLDPGLLERALAEQPGSGRRICSLLISRGELDPDHAARALATQHQVAGVLQRHLEQRDPALASLLPSAIARSLVALPIGRTGRGELVICVRDPRPELRGRIAAAVAGPVVIAVAPAHQLEQLVQAAYPRERRPADEPGFDVELNTRPIAVVRDIVAAVPEIAEVAELGDVDVDLSTRQISVIGDPLDHLASMALVELDDHRVARDPSQSGQHIALLSRAATEPMVPLRPETRSYPPPRAASGSSPPRPHPQISRVPTLRGPALDTAVAALAQSASLEAAADAAMHYLAGAFRHAVWFTIHEGAALGERGHGDQLTTEVIQAMTVPLGALSIVQLAHDTRRLATAPPPGAGTIQDRLTRSLGYPRAPAALPIEVDGRVACVITVGDPDGDPATAARDLDQLGRALTGALQRLATK